MNMHNGSAPFVFPAELGTFFLAAQVGALFSDFERAGCHFLSARPSLDFLQWGPWRTGFSMASSGDNGQQLFNWLKELEGRNRRRLFRFLEIGPNSLFTSLKERARTDLKRLNILFPIHKTSRK